MNKHLQAAFLARRFFAILSLICLCLIALFTTFVSTPQAHAASSTSDPFVTIAVDATPSLCTITHTVKKHASSLVTHTHCPAGTAISITKVLLSQAKAQHETYVKYPASPQQIQEVIQAKRTALQSAPHKAIPCGGGGNQLAEIFATYYQPGTHTNGTDIEMNAYYYEAGDCSTIFLDEEEVIGENPVRVAAYWTAVYYADYRPCTPVQNNFIGNNDLKAYPDVTKPDGLFNIWWIGANNSCTTSQATSYSIAL